MNYRGVQNMLTCLPAGVLSITYISKNSASVRRFLQAHLVETEAPLNRTWIFNGAVVIPTIQILSAAVSFTRIQLLNFQLATTLSYFNPETPTLTDPHHPDIPC